MTRMQRLLAWLLVLAVVPIGAITGPQPAQADPVPPTRWPAATLNDMPGVKNLAIHVDGSVTLGCTAWATTTVLKTFNGAGAVVQSTPATTTPRPEACPHQMAVASDGTVFIYAYNQSSYGFIQAYKSGSLVWQYSLPCGRSAYPASLVVGPNGNLYMHIINGSNCSSRLIGVTQNAQPGTTTPTELFSVMVQWDVMFGGLAVFATGLALFTPTTVQYRSFSGAVTATHQHGWNGLSYPPFREHFDATVNGRTFAANKASGAVASLCEYPNQITGSLTAFEPSSIAWGIVLPGCHQIFDLRPTPKGGVVIQSRWQQESGFPHYNKITAYSPQGVELWHTLSEVRSDAPASPRIAVDLNGNVATRTFTRVRKVINSSQYWFGELQLSLLNGTSGQALPGTVLALRGDTTTPNGPSYKLAAADVTDIDVFIGKDVAYVPAITCTTFSNCDDANPKLYAFSVPGLEIDYPRGAILRYNEPWKRYVAMGDSFSSGQGVKPYQAGTDVVGPPENRCRRSEQGAYSKLLDGNVAARLNLTAFVACGGAETYHVINGRYGEGSQLDALSTDTDVVTITIGGNDIGFGDFVYLCLFKDCGDPVVNQPFFQRVAHDLPDSLSNLYSNIRTRAPNAKVYVLGYPQLLPVTSCPQTDSWMEAFNSLVTAAHNESPAGSWTATLYSVGEAGNIPHSDIESLRQAGTFEFNAAESGAARLLVGKLNEKIGYSVLRRYDPNFFFVDPLAMNSPFIGHELCTAEPYFNGLDIPERPNAFHPNSRGQEAYKELFLRSF